MATLEELQQQLNEFKENEQALKKRIADLTTFIDQSINPLRLKDLEENEARLRMAIASTNLGTWDYNPVTGALNWSDECRKIYGLPNDITPTFEIFATHIHPDDHDDAQKSIQQAMDPKGDGLYDITYRILRFDDNSVRWIKAQGKVYFDETRKPARFIGTVVDITESKLLNEKIIKSERLFRSIALNIPNTLIIVIDAAHRFVVVEGDIMEKMGYDSKNYEGKHPLEVSPPERYEASKPLYERVLAGEKFFVERKAQTGEDFMIHFVPLKNDANEVYAGLIIAMDITDIKQAEERSAKLAAIVESSDDAIISKDLESIVTSWNISAERTFGYTETEMIGQSIVKLIPPDRVEEEPHILSRLKRGERVEHFETKRVTKYGKLLDVSLTISPIKDPQGKIIGLSKIARDITEKKQEETRKHDFIAMVSHELKTPLTSIQAYIQLLLAKTADSGDSFIKNALARTEVQAKKMTAMIQDFLNLARLEEGKIQLSKVVFELNPMIAEVVNDSRLVTSTHRIDFKGCAGVKICGDKDKIGQVLINLLSNAGKYSAKGSNIYVECGLHEKKVQISVRDEGVGINPNDQKRLFDRFYRVENEKIKNISGFGIGLYLVSEILKYHDSTINVTSEEGIGSTFYFSLDIV